MYGDDNEYQSLYRHDHPETEKDVLENILFRMAVAGGKLEYYSTYDNLKVNMGSWGIIAKVARDLRDFAEDMERTTESRIEAIQNVCTPAELGIEADEPDYPERLTRQELVRLDEAIADETIDFTMIRTELRPQITFHVEYGREPDDEEFKALYRR